MPNDDQMLEQVPGPRQWENWHETVSGTVAGIDKVHPPLENPPYGSKTINRCTRQIQRSMADAKQKGKAYRAVGRAWSLSDAPLSDGVLLDISVLIGKKKLRADQLDPGYKGNAEARNGLCLIQCGNYISEINAWLETKKGLSFKTTGAANGQTIAGATATGTHGSALDFGALHDHIVAIHLLAGPEKQYWLERASYPVMKHSLPNSINAELLRDDDVFNAVLVGLGAFGVIHNVVIEARPRFLLNAYNYDAANNKKLVFDAAMRQRIAHLDFSLNPDLDPPADPENPDGPDTGRPYFFQPIINPNTNPPEVLITQMHDKPWKTGHNPDYLMPAGKFGPGYDFVTVAGRALDLFQSAVPLFAQLVAGQLFTLGRKSGSWGEQFGYKAHRTKVASGTVAVPLEHALATLDALIDLNGDIGPVPLVFGCRYVKKSPALLAFNQWETTFVISIDGVYNNSALNFLEKIPEKMEALGIPYSQHWGKTNGYNPQRIRATYGGNVDKWKAARARLLPDAEDRAMFENAFMRRAGLAD
ncbi:MAG: FAD-binding protein [Pseudomonadota bacterium]